MFRRPVHPDQISLGKARLGVTRQPGEVLLSCCCPKNKFESVTQHRYGNYGCLDLVALGRRFVPQEFNILGPHFRKTTQAGIDKLRATLLKERVAIIGSQRAHYIFDAAGKEVL